jgi:FkbM family methyltransferase
MSVLQSYRKLRESSGAVRQMNHLMREPYYCALEVIYRRGAPARLADGTPVRLHPRFLGWRPEAFEAKVVAALARLTPPGGTVIDVGAHVGLHTLLFSSLVGAAGRVLAVEPSPANASLLRRHLVWNQCRNVSVIEAAIGENAGSVRFCFRTDPTDPTASANSIAYDIGGDAADVPVATLDDICRFCAPDLIKVDVEGAELLVLRGAEETLAHTAPILVVSIHPELLKMLGSTPTELVAFLSKRGYEGRDLDGRGVTNPGFEEIIFQKNGAKAQ